MNYQVLIMEDDRDLSLQWKAAIQERHMEVTLAASRSEAEAFVAEKRFDALVTDLFTTKGDGGLVLIGHLRQPGLTGTPEWAAKLPILAITAATGSDESDPLEFALHYGANAVLRKPFTSDELYQSILRLIVYGGRPLFHQR